MAATVLDVDAFRIWIRAVALAMRVSNLAELRTLTVIFSFVLMAATFAFVPSTFSAVKLYFSSSAFSAAEGTVSEKKVSMLKRGGSGRGNGTARSKHCEFRYEYTVKGARYQGTRLSLDTDNNEYGVLLYSTPFCANFRKVNDVGGSVRVLYNSANPQESIILRRLPAKRLLNVCLVFLGWAGLVNFFLKTKVRLPAHGR
jgi:Protein of unknown function (DUF3592)